MKKEIRLYNVLFPIWLLWLFPQIWLVVLPGNLLVDCLVLFLALTALKCRNRGAVVKQLWWKFWLLGFLADFVGVAALLPCLFLMSVPGIGGVMEDMFSPLMHNPFLSLPSFLWMAAAVALAGYCIYRFDMRAMRDCDALTDGEKKKIALAMAVCTAPWLFFVPMY